MSLAGGASERACAKADRPTKRVLLFCCAVPARPTKSAGRSAEVEKAETNTPFLSCGGGAGSACPGVRACAFACLRLPEPCLSRVCVRCSSAICTPVINLIPPCLSLHPPHRPQPTLAARHRHRHPKCRIPTPTMLRRQPTRRCATPPTSPRRARSTRPRASQTTPRHLRAAPPSRAHRRASTRTPTHRSPLTMRASPSISTATSRCAASVSPAAPLAPAPPLPSSPLGHAQLPASAPQTPCTQTPLPRCERRRARDHRRYPCLAVVRRAGSRAQALLQTNLRRDVQALVFAVEEEQHQRSRPRRAAQPSPRRSGRRSQPIVVLQPPPLGRDRPTRTQHQPRFHSAWLSHRGRRRRRARTAPGIALRELARPSPLRPGRRLVHQARRQRPRLHPAASGILCAQKPSARNSTGNCSSRQRHQRSAQHHSAFVPIHQPAPSAAPVHSANADSVDSLAAQEVLEYRTTLPTGYHHHARSPSPWGVAASVHSASSSVQHAPAIGSVRRTAMMRSTPQPRPPPRSAHTMRWACGGAGVAALGRAHDGQHRPAAARTRPPGRDPLHPGWVWAL